VLGNAGHKLHADVTRLRQSWMGNASNADVSAKMGVFARQLGRMPITVGATTGSHKQEDIDKSPIGMMAGRPPTPGMGRFPGFATPGASQAPVPPGMTLREDRMPPSDSLAQRHSPTSAFTKRTWTVIHEGSHGILGTYDYRTYRQAELPMAHGSPMGPKGGHIQQRAPETGKTFPDIAQRNADSWAGFVMHASEHIRQKSATGIQAAFRGFAERKELKRQHAAATKVQAVFRGFVVRKQLKEGAV
jgi:hypothetical protein